MRKNNFPYPDDLAEFMVNEGMRNAKKPGKLKYFYEMEEHPGWYAFISENRTLFITIDTGLDLGFFIKVDENTVRLNPKLEEQLEANEPKS